MKKQSLFFCFFVLLMVLGTQSFAQDDITINPSDEQVKSISKARNIALLNTGLSIGTGIAAVALFDNNTVQTGGAILGVYGLMMGPSTGNFYANDYPRGMIGAAARTVGAILMIDATSEIFGNQFANSLNVDDKDVSLTDTKILIGEVLVLGSMVYNIISSKTSVKAYNQQSRKFSMNVSPAVIDDQVTPMVTANIRF